MKYRIHVNLCSIFKKVPPPAMNKEKFQIALINCCGVWVMSHFVYLVY